MKNSTTIRRKKAINTTKKKCLKKKKFESSIKNSCRFLYNSITELIGLYKIAVESIRIFILGTIGMLYIFANTAYHLNPEIGDAILGVTRSIANLISVIF